MSELGERPSHTETEKQPTIAEGVQDLKGHLGKYASLIFPSNVEVTSAQREDYQSNGDHNSVYSLELRSPRGEGQVFAVIPKDGDFTELVWNASGLMTRISPDPQKPGEYRMSPIRNNNYDDIRREKTGNLGDITKTVNYVSSKKE